MQITQKRNKTTLVLIIAATILVVSGGYFAYAYVSENAWPFSSSSASDDTGENSEVNYSPPTDQEIESSQDAKRNNAYQDPGNEVDAQSGEKQSVSVGIAFAGYEPDEGVVDVRAFTPNVIEGGGTCTATFQQGSLSVNQSSKAFIDSSSSQCEPILIPESRFATKGSWKLTVSYESDNYRGISPEMDIEVGR